MTQLHGLLQIRPPNMAQGVRLLFFATFAFSACSESAKTELGGNSSEDAGTSISAAFPIGDSSLPIEGEPAPTAPPESNDPEEAMSDVGPDSSNAPSTSTNPIPNGIGGADASLGPPDSNSSSAETSAGSGGLGTSSNDSPESSDTNSSSIGGGTVDASGSAAETGSTLCTEGDSCEGSGGDGGNSPTMPDTLDPALIFIIVE